VKGDSVGSVEEQHRQNAEHYRVMRSCADSPGSRSVSRLAAIPRLSIIVLCLLSMVVSGRQALWYLSHGPSVSDFRIFMTGIELLRTGQGKNLYSFEAQQRAQTGLYPETVTKGLLPFNHLAFELLFYWPVSRLSFQTAIMAWAVVNVGVVFLIGRLLAPYTRAVTRITGFPVAVFLFAFFPVIYALGEGQDSILFFLLVVLSLRAMDAGHTFMAGFLLALGCFKFHLALSIAFFVLVLAGKWRGTSKWRGLSGLAAGGILVGGVSLAMVGRGFVTSYLAMLRYQSERTPWGFIPWFMPNLRGFLQWALARWLDYGLIAPVIFVVSAVVGVAAAWLCLRGGGQRDFSLVYPVAILTTLLISYHVHMQDLAIAALPVLVLVDREISEGTFTERAMIDFRSRAWAVALMLAVAGLYLFRIVAEPFPVLVLRGCLLAVPLLLLWIVAFRAYQNPPALIG